MSRHLCISLLLLFLQRKGKQASTCFPCVACIHRRSHHLLQPTDGHLTCPWFSLWFFFSGHHVSHMITFSSHIDFPASFLGGRGLVIASSFMDAHGWWHVCTMQIVVKAPSDKEKDTASNWPTWWAHTVTPCWGLFNITCPCDDAYKLAFPSMHKHFWRSIIIIVIISNSREGEKERERERARGREREGETEKVRDKDHALVHLAWYERIQEKKLSTCMRNTCMRYIWVWAHVGMCVCGWVGLCVCLRVNT